MVDLIDQILQFLRDEKLNVTKETHPGKTFIDHVKECAHISTELLERIFKSDIDKEQLKRFTIALCALHDVGKLDPKWQLNLEKLPPHSPKSAEWILRKCRGRWLSGFYDDLLAYFAYVHHSSLLLPIKIRNKELCKLLVKAMKLMSREKKIKLVDAFGTFKLADFASVAGIPCSEIVKQYEWYSEFDERIKFGVIMRAKKKVKKVDNHKFKIQMKIACSNSKHLLIAAPTGWGKTAVALFRIAHLKPYKIFYVLPTITAIKDLYSYLRRLMPEDYIGEYFYFADVELLRRDYLDEDYALDLYRFFIPKFIITTADQLFLTMLQVGKYYLRRFNLKNSLLIFDEFHLLTPQMIGALRALLKSLSKIYNFSCLFMSATPSPLYCRKISEAIADLTSYILKSEYEKLQRHRIELINQTSIKFISDSLQLLENNRTLIIVNTIRDAQKIYKILEEYFNGKRKIILLHSEFSYKDRSRRESEIDNADILVSTQVAEVSLDVSFDILITELAPLPSLIQRFGRVNRYGERVGKTNVYICEPKTSEPYDSLEMDWSRKKIRELKVEVEQRGEVAYLSNELWSFEELFDSDIDISESFFRECLENLNYFYSVQAKYNEISVKLGRTESWLALPEIYADYVRELKRQLSKTKNYIERRNIYAKIKEYYVPISRNHLKKYKWDDELQLPIIENYDEKLGVLLT